MCRGLRHYQWLKQLSKFSCIQDSNSCPRMLHKLLKCQRVPTWTVHRQLCKLHNDLKASSVTAVVDRWTETFTQEGIPEPKESAGLIVAYVLGKKTMAQVDETLSISAEQSTLIDDMCEKRLKRCPVQYIIGEWDFQDMTLHMEPPVLIPRTETEELADYIVEALRKFPSSQPIRVLDIGSGTGALGLFLLKELSNVTCVAVDINKTACNLTQKNARKYNLQDRLHVVHGDINKDLTISQVESSGPFDVIVSNPPYIPSADMEKLDLQVYGYEDHTALHGGIDGMDVIRDILAISLKLLKQDSGQLWLEVDLSHPKKIEELVQKEYSHSLEYIQTLKDYTNRERFCLIKRSNLMADMTYKKSSNFLI